MALSTIVGSFASLATVGNQSITGLGFRPKLILFFSNSMSADGDGADAFQQIGCAAATTQRWSGAISVKDGATNSTVNSRIDVDGCIGLQNTDGTLLRKADLVSFDSDGFTINWATANATAHIINYFALGGSDLSHVQAGSFAQATSTGVHAVTGVGFSPDCVLFYAPVNSSAAGAFLKNTSGALGVMTAAGDQWYLGWREQNNSTNPSNQGRQLTDHATGQPSSTTVFAEAAFSSMDSDGFSLNWTTASASPDLVLYVAIKGGTFKAGSKSGPTALGTQAYTGIGFTPQALLLASYNNPTQSNNQSNDRLSIGVATGAAARFSMWRGSTLGTVVAKQNLRRDRILRCLTESPTAVTANMSADLASLDADGFTLNVTTTDGSPSKQILYLAFGSSSGLSATATPATATWTIGAATGIVASAFAWIDLVNTTGGATLTKTSGDGATYNGEGRSSGTLTGDGFFSFTIPALADLMVGLSRNLTNTNDITLIDFFFQPRADGSIEIRELGDAYKSDFTYAAGDSFRIGVSAGVVTYYQNGALKYTSATPAALPLGAKGLIATVGGQITAATLSASTGATLPGAASTPSPASNAAGVTVSPTLSWAAGGGAASHDVYFGTVNPPTTLIGNQPGNSYAPGTLATGTTYYWRVDERNAAGVTAGQIWAFTTASIATVPGPATNPNPANRAIGVALTPSLAWTPDPGATSHDVFFGSVTPPPSIGNQTAANFQPAGVLAIGTTYYWRVNERNAIGSTVGPIWSFTTTPQAKAYNLIADRTVLPKPDVATIGFPAAAGGTYVDPLFGTTIRRVTDDTMAGGKSYMTPSSEQCFAWNITSTMFYTTRTDGQITLWAFDPVTGIPTMRETVSFTNEPTFSQVDARYLYGIRGFHIDQYDTSLKTYVTLGDLTVIDPTHQGTAVGGTLQSSGSMNGSPERLVAFYGGNSQDHHYRVLVFNKPAPGAGITVSHILDTMAQTIDGVSIGTVFNGNVGVTPGIDIHAVGIDRTGRYVIVYTSNQNLSATPPVQGFTNTNGKYMTYVWDVDGGTVAPITWAMHPFGHDAMGYGVRVNQDVNAVTYDGIEYQERDLSALATPHDIIVPPNSPKEVYIADHPNWNNAKPGALVPFITGIYRYWTGNSGPGGEHNDVPWRAWDDELILVDPTPGTNQYRVCHHRSDVTPEPDTSTANGGPNIQFGFWYTPRPQISPDGNWAFWTSNMDKTLGYDPGRAVGAPDRKRTDVLMVSLQQSTILPPVLLAGSAGIALGAAGNLTQTAVVSAPSLFARSGVARAGATRSGYFFQNVIISIDGVTRSDLLWRGSLKWEEVISEGADLADLQMFGDFEPQELQDIIIAFGSISNPQFGGTITKAKRIWNPSPNPAHKVYTISATDWTFKLAAENVYEQYESTQAHLIFLDMAAKYAPGFTVNNVQAPSPVVPSFVSAGDSLPAAFTRLARLIGWDWYPAPDKDLHFFEDETDQSPLPITTTSYSYWNFDFDADVSQLRTQVRVQGGGASVPTAVLPGATSIDGLTELTWYSPTGGLLQAGGQLITYAGLNATTGSLVGIPPSGPGSIVFRIPAETNINIHVVVDDLAQQAAIAALTHTNGIFKFSVTDQRLGYDACVARGTAELLYSSAVITGSYSTFDRFARAGKLLTVNRPDRNLVGNFTISNVKAALVGPGRVQRDVTFTSATPQDFFTVLRNAGGDPQDYASA